MRNKLRKIVGSLLTFALAFTIFGGEAKAVNAAAESAWGWNWTDHAQETGSWTKGAIGGYFKEDEVYFKIDVTGFQGTEESVAFKLSKAKGYEQNVEVILSTNGNQKPRSFEGADGLFSLAVESAPGADDHIYTITYTDKAKLAEMKNFTIYITAKLAPGVEKQNSSHLQFGMVDQGAQIIPFAGNGIKSDGMITIIKELKDHTGKLKNDADTFKVTVTGPSHPDGTEFDLVNGTDLVIDDLEPGKYTVTENVDATAYETEIDGQLSNEALVNLNGRKPFKEVVITNIEKTRDITAKKEWVGGPEKRPVVTLVLLRNEVPVGEKALVYPEVEATWADMPVKDDLGMPYVYTVDEKEDFGYYAKAVDGFTVTNTYTEKVIDIEGEKTWVGEGGKPEKITVRLFMNDVEFASQEVKEGEDGTWRYVFKDVPEMDAEEVAYVYTVKEDAVPGFLAEYDDNHNIVNTAIKADVVVTKVDEKEEVLPGAEFTLYQDDEKVGEAVVTGLDGKATFRDIPYGTYTLKETKAPEGYVKSEDVKEIRIEDMDVVEETFKNNRIMGTVEITKVDKEDHEKVLEGAKFSIADKAGKEVFTGTTDSQGMIVTKLPYGTYLLSEVEPPKDYEKTDRTWEINIVENDETIELHIENVMIEIIDVEPLPLEMGTLRIRKVDKETDKPLAGVRFSITDKDGDVLFEGLTDAEGMIEEELAVGEYLVKELEALPGYVLSKKPETVKIKKDGEVVELTVTNKKMYGQLIIKKVDAETGDVLEGAKFKIVDKNGVVILEDYTDEDGLLEVWLPIGKYIISETEAPEDYIETEETWSVNVTRDNEVFNLVVENEMIEIEIVSPITLPQTGGIPSESLYILGAFAIFTGMQLTRKRKTV